MITETELFSFIEKDIESTTKKIDEKLNVYAQSLFSTNPNENLNNMALYYSFRLKFLKGLQNIMNYALEDKKDVIQEAKEWYSIKFLNIIERPFGISNNCYAILCNSAKDLRDDLKFLK